MDVTVGRTLNRLHIRIVSGSSQSFALAWFDDNESPLDLTGKTVRIVLNGVIWVAAVTENRTQWDLTSTQSRVPRQVGRLEVVGDDVVVAYSVSVEPQ